MPSWAHSREGLLRLVGGVIGWVGERLPVASPLACRCRFRACPVGCWASMALPTTHLALCSEHTLAMNFTIWFEAAVGLVLAGASLWHLGQLHRIGGGALMPDSGIDADVLSDRSHGPTVRRSLPGVEVHCRQLANWGMLQSMNRATFLPLSSNSDRPS